MTSKYLKAFGRIQSCPGRGNFLDGRKKYVKPQYNPAFDEEDEEDEDVVEGPTLESQFGLFVKRSDPTDPGTHISLTQINLWLKQAGVIQVRKLTKTDTGVCYFHFKKYKLDYEEFNEFILLLANRKKIPPDEITGKLVMCGPPQQEDEMKR